MEKAARWVLDGPIMYDAGDVGGDIQVGPAIQARFRSDDCPEARFEITAYATAKQYMDVDEPDPDCPHSPADLKASASLREEHLACSFKPGTMDVQEQVTYRMNGYVDEYGNYESDDTDPTFYDWVGSPYDYPGDTLPEQIRNATKDAKKHVEDFAANVNHYLSWDGRTEPKG